MQVRIGKKAFATLRVETIFVDYSVHFISRLLLDRYRLSMQRLHRIGNVIFLLTLVALTFHLLAVSYDQWRRTTCKTCSNNQTFYQWTNSIRHRCYWMPLMNNVSSGSLSVKLCIPNQYLYARAAVYIDTCLQAASLEPHTVCVNGHFNRDACKCE